MIINRVWAMPNKWTFKIKPINELLLKYIENGNNWVDCFSGQNTLVEYTNDFDNNTPAKFHMLASEFIKILPNNLNGVIYDPPYSPRQISECYKQVNKKCSMLDTSARFYSETKNLLSEKVKIGGFAISCGWNTCGFGINRGFELIEILLVCHGGAHNDTIVTVEKKVK